MGIRTPQKDNRELVTEIDQMCGRKYAESIVFKDLLPEKGFSKTIIISSFGNLLNLHRTRAAFLFQRKHHPFPKSLLIFLVTCT